MTNNNKAQLFENKSNRPPTPIEVDEMSRSNNNWGTNTFQYVEYDPNQDIINLESLKQDENQ